MKKKFAAPLCKLFAEPEGVWLKGNTHTHTSISDGRTSLEEVVRWYDQAGYDFLFITDHEEKLDEPGAVHGIAGYTTDTLTVIPGLEWKIPYPENRLLHVVVLGDAPTEKFSADWCLKDTIRFTHDEGLLLVLAHPYWSAMTHHDLAEAEGAVALEVYNTTCQVVSGKGFSPSYWDYLLQHGVHLHGIAADDAHWSRPIPDYGGGWIMVRSTQRSPHAILHALREGRFYATCGPRFIDVMVNGDQLEVVTSPVKSIHFITHNGHSSVEHAVDKPYITSAARTLRSFKRYLRIECVDEKGCYAWTNAVLLPDT